MRPGQLPSWCRSPAATGRSETENRVETHGVEIGATLREARERRRLLLDDVEAATRIRRTYLAALEDERFHVIRGDAYVRAFLREYAEFLGLDGDVLVAEYVSRFPREDDEPAALLPPPPRPRLWTPARAAALVGVAGAIALVAVLAFRPGSGPKRVSSPPPPPAAVRRTKQPPVKQHPTRRHAPTPPATTWLVLTACDRCWLEVRRGSATGPVVYENTLVAGESERFRAGNLWILIGAPWALQVKLGGRLVDLPIRETGNVLVGRTAIRSA